MKEYRVINFKTTEEAEKTMNDMAKSGWIVISSIPSKDINYIMIIIFEKDNYNY